MAVSTPWAAFHKRPVTVAVLVMIGITMIWLSLILFSFAPPPGALELYAGPLEFCSFRVWSILFLAAGIIEIGRIPLLDYGLTSLALHVPVMIVAVAWAVSFDLGPPTTGQPTTTFLAAIVLVSPFISPIVVWSAKQVGFAFVATPRAQWTEDAYTITHRPHPMRESAFQARQLTNDQTRLPTDTLNGPDRGSLPRDLT